MKGSKLEANATIRNPRTANNLLLRHFEYAKTILDKTVHFNTRRHTMKPND
jgi:hypothetical protein